MATATQEALMGLSSHVLKCFYQYDEIKTLLVCLGLLIQPCLLCHVMNQLMEGFS